MDFERIHHMGRPIRNLDRSWSTMRNSDPETLYQKIGTGWVAPVSRERTAGTKFGTRLVRRRVLGTSSVIRQAPDTRLNRVSGSRFRRK